MTVSVSLIIPTFKEAAYLDRTLDIVAHLDPPPLETIVVDGGSQDETLAVAASFSVQVLRSPARGRAVQMNAGARQARGDILVFLHADTQLPFDAIAVIQRTLSDKKVACGGFISLMAGAETTRWGISLHNALKTYYTAFLFRPICFWQGLRILFGDQVMFCRRADFLDCGGFDTSLPIMEDAALCMQLLPYGRIVQVNRVVQSSDRRVAAWGAWKATGIYLTVGCLWAVGVPARWLKAWYDDVR